MLKNNGKIIIGRNFLFCLCVICLMFTAIGVESSYAAELNDTADEISLESNNVEKLENSQKNEILEANSQDSNEVLGATKTPTGNIYKSIQDAINSANAGDTIKLSGTYHSNGNDRIIIDKQLTIMADSTATLDGKNLCTAFFVKSGGAGTVFKNLKFINGKGDVGSVIWIEAKNVRVENCIFEDNHANYGGAVYTKYDLNAASGTIVENCEFRRNSAYYDDLKTFSCSAALSVYGKDSEIRNCVFEDNWVKSNVDCFGGAIQVGLDEPGSNGKVINCIFKNNKAISTSHLSHGGAGCVRDGTSYINCIFIGNCADQGGALTFHASGKIENCSFSNNEAYDYGGALSTGFFYDYMSLNIVNCNFDGNTAPLGGAIQAKGLNIQIDDSIFKRNYATKYGGAVNIEAEDVTIKDSIFNSNKANINGGAVYIKGTDTSVENSTFISNEAIPDVAKLDDGLGGAIYVDSSRAFIKDSSFTYNTARNGSAIYYDEFGEKLRLENNVLYQNQAWVYHLPISAQDIYYEDSENIKVVIYGGNNIADYDNLAVSNAIYNAAGNVNIVIDGQYPIYGATNTGELYQDGREYNINVLLTVQHEDGTLVYNEVGHTNYLGAIDVKLDNLKPGTYYVSAKHYEDTYYKGITNSTTFVVNPKVDIEVTKTSSKAVADFEDVVIWTVTVKNHGPNDATGVEVTDVLPEGLIWLNDTSKGKYNPKTGGLTIGDFKVGESFTFDITTVIDATGDIVNKVKVTSNEFDTNESNNYAEKSIFVNPAADLKVEKSVSNTKPNYKDNIIWTIKISNNGPDTAHDVKMYDVLPKSLIFVGCDGDYDYSSGIWNIGTLEKGAVKILNIECIVDKTDLTENSVKVNGSEYDYDLTNNNDSERIFVHPAADLAIIKMANASVVNFNDIVKWTLIISNNGPDEATNVMIVDVLPSGFSYLNSTISKGKYEDNTFVIDNLAVGEIVTVDILTLVEDTGNAINHAEVSSDNYDFNLTNNEDDEDISVNPAADLSVTKSVSDSNPFYGDIITWTIEVINYGPDTAHNVTISDLLPDSLVWISDDSSDDYDPKTGILFIEELDVEETYILEIECRVNATGSIENIVTVNASEYDYNITNNFYNETVDVEKSVDVSVIKSVNNTSPNYNDLVKWTLVISNKGPDKATDVYVEDELPDGLILVNYTATKGFYDEGKWVMCCLENGESQTLEMICRVNKTGKIINLATIYADEYDYNESNNVDNESIDVPLAVDLQVTVDVNDTNPIFGESVNWIISVKNNGPDDATNVILEDFLPEELIYEGYELSKGSFENLIWNIGNLNVGDVVYLNIATCSNALGIITNNAKVDAAEYDWNMSNNVDDSEIDVRPIADLSVIKLVDNDSPKYGDKVKWTIVVSNNGPNAAHGVKVEDVLPEGLKFISSNGDYSKNIWNVGTLNVGDQKSLVIVCKVISTGNFINKAKVWANELDLDESNNHADESINVAPASDLAITKIASKYNYRVGDVIEYVIEVVNKGPDTAKNIKVSEILDDLLKLKSFKVSKGKFDIFTNAWTIKSLRYGESAKLVIKVVATGSGIIKNTVKVTSDTFDYDKSNNKDFAVVNVTKKPSDGLSHSSKNSLNGNALSNLQMHPTANPFMLLVVCLVFSMAFFGEGVFRRR